MRTDRVAINAGLSDLLALRGMETFDLSPVVVVDDQRESPFPGFTRWLAAAAVAAGVGSYPQFAIANLGQGQVVIDTIRIQANGAANDGLYVGMLTVLRAQGVVGAFGLNTMLQAANPGLDLPNFGAVQYMSTGSSSTTWAPTLFAPTAGLTVLLERAGLILPPQTALLLRWGQTNVSAWFSVSGRYYDAA